MGRMIPKFAGAIGLAVALVVAAATPTAAQTRQSFDCSSSFFFPEQTEESQFGYIAAACGRSTISRQLLINSIDVIPRVVANSFHIGPDKIEPAGLADLSPSEFDDRLKGGESLIVTPTADAPAAAVPSTSWNMWADGKYTWNDNGPAAMDLDGALVNLLAGIDYKLGERVTLGVMASIETSDLDGDMANLESDGIGIGPYVGVVLTDNIVFSANLLGSRVDSSQFDGLLAFDSDRVQASASLTGYWYFNLFRVTPGVSISWSKEWIEEDSGFALPDQTVETAMLTPSLQLGNTFSMSDQSTIEPWAGVAWDYVFTNTTSTDGLGSIKDPYSDLRVQAGFNFGFGNNAQLTLTTEFGGLTSSDLDTYAFEGMFSFQF